MDVSVASPCGNTKAGAGLLSVTMVGVSDQDGVGAVELLQEHDTDHHVMIFFQEGMRCKHFYLSLEYIHLHSIRTTYFPNLGYIYQ